MTVRYYRPVSHAAYFSRRLALFALVLFVIATLLHRFGPLETPYFLALGLISGVLAALALYLAIVGIAQLWIRGARGGKNAAHALVLILLPLVPVGIAGAAYITLPPLYDVTTDIPDPPVWIEEVDANQSWLGARPPVTEDERQAQTKAYPGLTGRRYEGGLDRVYAAARKVAEENGIRLTHEKGAPSEAEEPVIPIPATKGSDEAVADSLDLETIPVPVPRPSDLDSEVEAAAAGAGDGILQGVVRSQIFGFRQDIVIRLHEEAETTLVDVRVASRYGQHDLGSGAQLIERYLRALDAELLGIAGG